MSVVEHTAVGKSDQIPNVSSLVVPLSEGDQK